MHGEAHTVMFEISAPDQSNSTEVTFTGKLPIVQEMLRRTFRMVKGESVVYVDSELENLMGFDRPINWGEHATIWRRSFNPMSRRSTCRARGHRIATIFWIKPDGAVVPREALLQRPRRRAPARSVVSRQAGISPGRWPQVWTASLLT